MGVSMLRFVPIVFAVALVVTSLLLAVLAWRQAAQLRRERAELRELLARVKDIAWDQRELDPSLSTIIIDEIRTYEKKELGK
jgi:hypothetical protein